MEIAIGQINVKSNPRTDFGQLDELTASVREKGIIEPLVVRKKDDNNYELIAGERRLKAAKAAGLEKVPVSMREGDDTDIEEVKLIENIHRKEFNPMEEAVAFQSYIDITKASIETLSQKISKPKLYVEKRLTLLTLPDEIQKALKEGTISMGHALVIARIDKKTEQKKLLKEIIKDKLSVNHAERQIKYLNSTIQLSEGIFNKDECKGCQHNGGEQSLLFDTCSEIKGLCLNMKCFHKKTLQHIKSETKKLKDKGINVLTERQLAKIEQRQRVYDWDNDQKDIRKRLAKEPDVFAVVFMEDYGKLKQVIYCINPSKRRPKSKNHPVDEKRKAKNAKERLTNKVSSFKTDFLIHKTQELIQPSTKESKAMTLFSLLESGRDWADKEKREMTEQIIEEAQLEGGEFGLELSFPNILKLEESEIDRLIAKASGMWVKHLHNELQEASNTFGVDLTEHFQITEEYLKPYTKDALIDLAKEIGLDKHLEGKGIEKWDKAKRIEIVDYFLNQGFDLTGKVPKLMAEVSN